MAVWTQQREADLIDAWGKISVSKLAKQMETSTGSIYRQARKLGLRTKQTKRKPLTPSHPAVRTGSPRYTHAIYDAETSPKLLVDGGQSRKIGKYVTKGPWSGMPIFTLTLAERETCPRSCAMWEACYGNNMQWARRHMLDHTLIERLRWELTALANRFPDGVVVRPHVLGDFGSDRDQELALTYVEAWHGWLQRFENLHIFGYTAWPPESEIGLAVMHMNRSFPDRCHFRFSGHEIGKYGAIVVDEASDSRHVLCPYETERVQNCGSCGLCWAMDRTVEFVRH